MLRKGNKLYSIITGACPKCHEENMYINKNTYILSKTLKMYDRCSNCNTKYKIEPSFFYGSMYISYGVGIAFALAAFVVSYVFVSASLLVAFIAIIVTMVGFLPIILRLSRNIWINLFLHYDQSLSKKKA
tara:strand:+ start:9425 stop:9814 length:390 start_codon:yes stop_codon:yes gene_type:complete